MKDEPKLLAFKDINPAAPAHVLVIPKNRNGLSSLRKSTPEHSEILGQLMVAAGEIARDTSLGFGDGARIVVNDGEVSSIHCSTFINRFIQPTMNQSYLFLLLHTNIVYKLTGRRTRSSTSPCSCVGWPSDVLATRLG